MPLKDAVQLVIQVQRPDGGFSCETRSGLPLVNPVYIAFCHVGSAAAERDMDQLVTAFRQELSTAAGGISVAPPCGGGLALGCHALAEPDCQKLLVLVGDGVTAVPPLPLLGLWGTDPSFGVLPVYPQAAQSALQALLPAGVRLYNTALWNQSVEEALPAVFAASNVTSEQPKIFISYRQVDSAELAIQLFDALSHEGFDVFLDHFRIPPGVNFQSRLAQELGDKSMVLIIESLHLQDSDWVLYEINMAKACGLGVCSVNLDAAPQVPGIDEEVRHRLAKSDFAGAVGGRLAPPALERLVARVRREHDRALLRRRIALEQSFEQAVRNAGGPPPVRGPNGAYRVSHPAKEYLTWLTVRPPDLPDFHYVHGAAQKPTIGVIIGLSRLLEPPRAARNDWLANLCDLRVLDEGRLVWAATEMARGAL
jgi:hypothetical protein